MPQVPRSSTKLDFEIFLESSDGRMTGELIFNSDLFDSQTAERIAGQFQARLLGVAKKCCAGFLLAASFAVGELRMRGSYFSSVRQTEFQHHTGYCTATSVLPLCHDECGNVDSLLHIQLSLFV